MLLPLGLMHAQAPAAAQSWHQSSPETELHLEGTLAHRRSAMQHGRRVASTLKPQPQPSALIATDWARQGCQPMHACMWPGWAGRGQSCGAPGAAPGGCGCGGRYCLMRSIMADA